MNHITLLGRLARDPEVKYTQNGKVCTSITLAVNRIGEGADFINVTIWDKAAELVGNSCQKGHRLLVEGRLSVRSYEKNGEKKTFWEVVARSVEFIEKKGTGATASPPESMGEATEEEIPF